MLQRQEFQHYTAAQVREHLTDALGLVEELDPPEDLRALVFVKAADLFSVKQITMQEVGFAPPDLAIPRGKLR